MILINSSINYKSKCGTYFVHGDSNEIKVSDVGAERNI